MLGVVEYLDDAEGYFKHAAASAKALLFTYCVSERTPDVDRDSNGWVNAFATPELEALLVACGWRIEQRWVYESAQCVILAVPAAAETPAWLRSRLDPYHVPARESQPRRPELVVTGFFARGNCGDEALLQCAFEAFEATHDLIVSVDEHGAYPGFWDWYPYNRMASFTRPIWPCSSKTRTLPAC